MRVSPHESETTETPNGAICYAFGILYPVIYLSTVCRAEQHPFLRFHCIQCLLLFFLLFPLAFLKIPPIPTLAAIAYPILLIGFFAALIQAGRRKMFVLPGIGNIAKKLA